MQRELPEPFLLLGVQNVLQNRRQFLVPLLAMLVHQLCPLCGFRILDLLEALHDFRKVVGQLFQQFFLLVVRELQFHLPLVVENEERTAEFPGQHFPGLVGNLCRDQRGEQQQTY